MFLDTIRRRNNRLIEQAIVLHQSGKIPANSYVIDLDAVEANARALRQEADRHNLKIFAMTKQMGRNASFCAAVCRGGIEKAVTVDMEDARACARAGMAIGHVGHLVQVPCAEANAASSLSPDYWTVFNMEKAREASEASKRKGRRQAFLARIRAEGDHFYRGHEGGFNAEAIVDIAAGVDELSGGRFAGITTFPALLFDPERRSITPTPNLATLEKAAAALAREGRKNIEINAPGTTSSVVLKALAEAGATQVEPGHGLTGTTPLHALEDLPELPAVIYVSEVSHFVASEAYCFGGGLYIDPVFPDYQLKAIVAREPTSSINALYDVEIPLPAAIDYYGMIDTSSGKGVVSIGDTVVFGFRPQIFVTRSYTVGVAGLATNRPEVGPVHDAFGRAVTWP